MTVRENPQYSPDLELVYFFVFLCERNPERLRFPDIPTIHQGLRTMLQAIQKEVIADGFL